MVAAKDKQRSKRKMSRKEKERMCGKKIEIMREQTPERHYTVREKGT